MSFMESQHASQSRQGRKPHDSRLFKGIPWWPTSSGTPPATFWPLKNFYDMLKP